MTPPPTWNVVAVEYKATLLDPTEFVESFDGFNETIAFTNLDG